ncbi:MAG: hypothetical protein Q7S46_04150, partial [Gallionella sp.]|nr:hypothetical protein [Gallionella sp.]
CLLVLEGFIVIKDPCTTTALADTALKIGSKSSCTKTYIPVFRQFPPCLSCARYVVHEPN